MTPFEVRRAVWVNQGTVFRVYALTIRPNTVFVRAQGATETVEFATTAEAGLKMRLGDYLSIEPK